MGWRFPVAADLGVGVGFSLRDCRPGPDWAAICAQSQFREFDLIGGRASGVAGHNGDLEGQSPQRLGIQCGQHPASIAVLIVRRHASLGAALRFGNIRG